MTTDTPRTDAAVTGNSDPMQDEYEDLAHFARTLERENISQMDTIHNLEAENGRAEELCQQLYDALIHMRSCGQCAEDNWSHCEGGKEAESAIEQFEKTHK